MGMWHMAGSLYGPQQISAWITSPLMLRRFLIKGFKWEPACLLGMGLQATFFRMGRGRNISWNSGWGISASQEEAVAEPFAWIGTPTPKLLCRAVDVTSSWQALWDRRTGCQPRGGEVGFPYQVPFEGMLRSERFSKGMENHFGGKAVDLAAVCLPYSLSWGNDLILFHVRLEGRILHVHFHCSLASWLSHNNLWEWFCVFRHLASTQDLFPLI